MLLRSRRPSEVSRFIIAVIVDTIYGVIGRRPGAEVLVDVVSECRIIVDPLRGNPDSPTSVVFVSFILGVETTVLHVSPTSV